ncbi:MAG: hypothetical protein ACK4SZ_15530 [Allosphingosinicella sp.]|uniref:hypothetical protein n=1 Tax=Allosphingosinicella sp. TaxID=2823234 RepID=UPI003942350D
MSEFRTALYYPYIDIDDPQWLRTAILFWEGIQTIVPSEIADPYTNPDTRLLRDEGLLTPLACDLQGELLEDLGRRVVKYVEQPEMPHGALGAIAGATFDMQRRPHKLARTLADRSVQARLHPAKMSHSMRDRLAGAHYDDEGFLLVDGPFAAFYMSALATRLARDTGTVALSNDSSAFGLQLSTMLDEVVSQAPTAAEGLLMSVVFESLTLDASIPIERVVRFRRQNEGRLQALAIRLEDLTEKIGSAENPRELREKAGRYYARQVRPEIENLKTSLEDAGIGAIWAGVRNAVTLSAGAGTALHEFMGWSANILLGAGAFVTVADIGVQAHLAGRKIRRESPFSYLLDVEQRFALPPHLTR